MYQASGWEREREREKKKKKKEEEFLTNMFYSVLGNVQNNVIVLTTLS